MPAESLVQIIGANPSGLDRGQLGQGWELEFSLTSGFALHPPSRTGMVLVWWYSLHVAYMLHCSLWASMTPCAGPVPSALAQTCLTFSTVLSWHKLHVLAQVTYF